MLILLGRTRSCSLFAARPEVRHCDPIHLYIYNQLERAESRQHEPRADQACMFLEQGGSGSRQIPWCSPHRTLAVNSWLKTPTTVWDGDSNTSRLISSHLLRRRIARIHRVFRLPSRATEAPIVNVNCVIHMLPSAAPTCRRVSTTNG
jgi:hypothetical protein